MKARLGLNGMGHLALSRDGSIDLDHSGPSHPAPLWNDLFRSGVNDFLLMR
jgi:hypothetical protein